MESKPQGPQNSGGGGEFYALVIVAFLLLFVSRCDGSHGEPEEDLAGNARYYNGR